MLGKRLDSERDTDEKIALRETTGKARSAKIERSSQMEQLVVPPPKQTLLEKMKDALCFVKLVHEYRDRLIELRELKTYNTVMKALGAPKEHETCVQMALEWLTLSGQPLSIAPAREEMRTYLRNSDYHSFRRLGADE